jgi:hypothetical protein
MSQTWTLADAADLCRRVEAVCPAFGCHVALTGGVLYKDGGRKDLDLLFYRVRQASTIDRKGLFSALKAFGLIKQSGWGWCYKATYMGKRVDMFFPDPAYPVPVHSWRGRVSAMGSRVRQWFGMSA